MDIRHAVNITTTWTTVGVPPETALKTTQQHLKKLKTAGTDHIKTQAGIGKQAGVTAQKMDSLNSIIGKVGMWAVATGAVYGLLRAMRAGADVTVAFDEKMTTLKALMEGAEGGMRALSAGAIEIAEKFGIAVTEVAGAMELWVRQGKNAQETLLLTSAAAMLANVSSISLKDAVSFLTGATRQYNLEAERAMDVTDKWVALDIKFAAEVHDIARAFSATGSTAHAFGVTLDELGGMVATLTETTRRGGAEIGRALRTIFVRLYRPATIRDLEVIAGLTAKTSAGFKPLMSILAELRGKWDSLTDSEKHYLAQSIAGLRQVDKFMALMSKFDRVIEGTLISFEAQGEAAARNKVIMESLAKTSASLTAEISGLVLKTAEGSGAINFFKNVLSGLTTTVGQTVIVISTLGLAAGVLTAAVIKIGPAIAGMFTATALSTAALWGWAAVIGVGVAGVIALVGWLGRLMRRQAEVVALTQKSAEADISANRARLGQLESAKRLILTYDSLGRAVKAEGLSQESRNEILARQADIVASVGRVFPQLVSGGRLVADSQGKIAEMTKLSNKAYSELLDKKLQETVAENNEKIRKSNEDLDPAIVKLTSSILKNEKELKKLADTGVKWGMVAGEHVRVQNLQIMIRERNLVATKNLHEKISDLTMRIREGTGSYSEMAIEATNLMQNTKGLTSTEIEWLKTAHKVASTNAEIAAATNVATERITLARLRAKELALGMDDLAKKLDRDVKSVKTFATSIFNARIELEKNTAALEMYSDVGLVTANERIKGISNSYLDYYKKLLDTRAAIEVQGASQEKLVQLYGMLAKVLGSSSKELAGLGRKLDEGNLSAEEASRIYEGLSRIIDTEVRESLVRMQKDIVQATKSIESMGGSFEGFFERILYDLDYAKDASKSFFEMMRQEMVKTIVEASRFKEMVFEPLAGLFIPRPRAPEVAPEVAGIVAGAIPTRRGVPGMVAGVPAVVPEQAKKAGDIIGEQAFKPSLMQKAGNYVGLAGFMAFQAGTASDRFQNQWKSLGFMMGAQMAASYAAKAQIGGIAGLGLPIVGGMLGMLIGGLFDKQEETTDQVQQVTRSTEDVRSGIDVSNKQLEIVNRNLSAIRQELEPWIMPESFYLRERLPEFQGGGTVAGGPSQKSLAVLHGQETVFTPKQLSALTEALSGPRMTIGSIQVGSEAQGRDVIQAIQEAFGGHRIRAYQGV